MQKALIAVEKLARENKNWKILSIEQLPESGSDRIYFRIFTGDKTFIGTYGLNVKENDTFIYFTTHFRKKQLPVSEIISRNEEGTAYIQTDFGKVSLLNKLEELGYNSITKKLFEDTLKQLAKLQLLGHAGIDYTKCLTTSEFGKNAINSDLLYFKYYFLDTLKSPYDKQRMLDDFEALANYLSHTEYKLFMFRDFQSRNVMVQDDTPYFIDYQGGMKGAPQYDVASLLWQAKANLPDEWKQELLKYYMDCLDELLPAKLDRNIFAAQYFGYVLIRLLQVLGAYGFRGLFERKAHFLSSIPQALRNLKWFVENRSLSIHVPEFMRMLKYCTSDEIISKFEVPAARNSEVPLNVYISSFSYLINGYPEDEYGNGGGFVFDCRGILNPGRIDEFKTQSGTDKEVINYLEKNTKMPSFLNSVFDIVDINVENYLERGFENLVINFGCTGGQHRSVYAAEQMARHLRNKYSLKTKVAHLNKENWKRK